MPDPFIFVPGFVHPNPETHNPDNGTWLIFYGDGMGEHIHSPWAVGAFEVRDNEPCWLRNGYEYIAQPKLWAHLPTDVPAFINPAKLEQRLFTQVSAQLPPESRDRFILGYSKTENHYDIYLYDGNWWNEGGTEITDHAPDYYYILPEGV